MKKKSINRRKFLAGGAAALPLAGGCAVASRAPEASARYASTPVLGSVDVLVVGGGPAGIGAALAAARRGVKCRIVESHSFFGGSMVRGLGKPMEEMRPASNPRSAVHELLIRNLSALGSQAVRINGRDVHPHVHYLKAAIVDALEEVRCSCTVHVRACDAVVEGNQVTGVVLITKQGLMRVDAEVVIDCTGDADIAFFAGAETVSAETEAAPMMLAAAYTNTEVSSVKTADVNGVLKIARGKYPLLPEKADGLERVSNCRFGCMDHSGMKGFGAMDPTDPVARSKAECDSRRQIVQMTQAMRESSIGALRRMEICEGAPQVCVPESRRIRGLYTLTRQDVESGADFPDTVARRYDRDDGCGIPYRTMLPETVDGLLAAGRCISAESGAVSNGAGNCMATGHAAGTAAALAVKGKITPRKVDVKALQNLLAADQVPLK